MTTQNIIQHLTLFAFIFEILQRILLAIINGIRLLFSAEYRDEVFGSDDYIEQEQAA